MADDQANSGGVFNPFEEDVPRAQSEPASGDSGAKLDEVKQDVIKKRKRRRNRRKKVFGGENGERSLSQSPAGQNLQDGQAGENDDFPDEPPEEQGQPEAGKNVPTPREEQRYKGEQLTEQKKKEEEKKTETQKIVQDQNYTDDYGEPVNPFDASPVSENAPAIDTKALEDKPMDRRDDGVAYSPFEDKPDAEAPAFSEEQVAEAGGVEENFVTERDNDLKEEKPGKESEVAEAEVVSSEPVLESEKKFDQDVKEFKEDFWSVLTQAGITKKHLIGFGIFFVVIILVILFFSFGGMELFKGDGEKSDGQDVEEKPKAKEEMVEEPGGQSSAAYGLITAYLVGQQGKNEIKTPIVISTVVADIAGIDTSLLIGIGEKADKIRYQYYISLLRKLLNIYQTDVYALVDLALDRRLALDVYLEEMNALIKDADGALIEINAIMNDIDARFEKVAEDKAFFEAEYFATTEALLTESSYNNLMEYVRVTQQTDKLKGFYNAYSFLRDMYNNALAKIRPRYKDIVLNKDAVIVGVRVFDVPSSDIKAIIRLSE